MLLDEAPNNVDLALFYVSCLQKLRVMNPKQEIDALLKTYLTGPFASSFFPQTDTMPGWYVGGTIQRQIVFIDGVRTLPMTTAFFNGYLPPLLLQFVGETQLWASQARDVILTQLSAAHVFASEWMDFVGYSAGGTIATLLKEYLVNNQAVQKSKVATFGSPRPGGAVTRDTLSRSPIARWMTAADPIPLMPPRIQDTPTLAVLFGVPAIIRMSNFTHTQGGIQINDDGTTTAVGLPTDAVVSPGTSLTSWLFGIEGDATNAHSLAAYFAALSAGVVRFPLPRQQDRAIAPAEPVNPPPSREVNRQRQRVETAIHNAGAAQNLTEPIVPDAVLFQAVRQGRIWVVEFGGKVVCTAPIEKRARHIARAGNDFLRSLPKQALVDPSALVDQFGAFLDASVDPASGFVPKVNTGISFE